MELKENIPRLKLIFIDREARKIIYSVVSVHPSVSPLMAEPFQEQLPV